MLNLFLFPFSRRRLLQIFNSFIGSKEEDDRRSCYGFVSTNAKSVNFLSGQLKGKKTKLSTRKFNLCLLFFVVCDGVLRSELRCLVMETFVVQALSILLIWQ